MKFAMLAVAVLAFAAFAGAQNTPPAQEARIMADTVTVVGNVVQLRGNVQIRRGGALILADEADVLGNAAVTAAPGGIELRGNVRLTSDTDIPLAINQRR
jgi:lipopolysaccharide export system protein LptA